MSFTPKIVDRRTQACAETVGILEEALAEAKAGRIHGVLLFAETDEGMHTHAWSDAMDYHRRVAALEMIKFQWMLDIHTEDE